MEGAVEESTLIHLGSACSVMVSHQSFAILGHGSKMS